MSREDLDGLEAFVTRLIGRALARVGRAATVSSVNTDGTINLDLGDGNIAPSQPAAASYSPRVVGDIVLAINRGGELFVVGKVGGPTDLSGGTDITIDNGAPPAGQGWEEVVSGQLWLKPKAIWGKRVTTYTPPAGVGTLIVTANRLTTYRGGVQTQTDVAEQGDYSGLGLQTGLATFGSGAFSVLSGKTCGQGTLQVHRSASPHGFSWSKQTFTAYRALATDPPMTTPTLIDGSYQGSAALNEDTFIAVDASWCQAFADGTASAVAFFSSLRTDNVEIDAAYLTIPYS